MLSVIGSQQGCKGTAFGRLRLLLVVGNVWLKADNRGSGAVFAAEEHLLLSRCKQFDANRGQRQRLVFSEAIKHSVVWLIVAVIVLGFRTAVGATEPQAAADPQPPPVPERIPPPTPLPPGVDSPPRRSLGEGLGPEGLPAGTEIILTPKAFQDLQAENARLRNELSRVQAEAKPLRPSYCKLSGKVDADVVRLTLHYRFRTDKANTIVALGCPQAQPTGALLDGKTAYLRWSDNGFQVQVEKPGDKELTLELQMGLFTRGNERGFDLDLPYCATTVLDLQLPEQVRGLRLGGKPLTEGPGSSLKVQDGRLVGPLGAVGRVTLTWSGASRLPGPPDLVAEGKIKVHVDEDEIRTECTLTLSALRGQVNLWRIQTPPGADVQAVRNSEGATDKEASAMRPGAKLLIPDDRVLPEAADPKATLRTIRLKEPSADPLHVVIRVKQKRPPTPVPQKTEANQPSLAPIPIGPFHVLEAADQHGTLEIIASENLALRYLPRGEHWLQLNRREITKQDRLAEPALAAIFHYRYLATHLRAEAVQPPALLELEIERIKDLVETQLLHILTLERDGDKLFWWITTRIDAMPVRTARVKELLVALPTDYEYDSHTGPEPATTQLELRGGTALITPGDDAPGAVRLSFKGKYRQPVGEAGQLDLGLPVPLGTRDRGGEVLLVIPRELQFALPRPGSSAWDDWIPGSNEHRWVSERLPRRIEVAWRPTDLVVRGKVNVTFRRGQGHVEHSLWFPSDQSTPERMRLRWPKALAERVTIVSGGEFVPLAPVQEGAAVGQPGRQVILKGPLDENRPLILRYFFSAPTNERREPGVHEGFALPLVWVDHATRAETEVRVWCDNSAPPLELTETSGLWQNLPVAAVSERADRLPDLIVWSPQSEKPPMLRFAYSGGNVFGSLAVVRALIQVELRADGAQDCRAGFWISRMDDGVVELELPVGSGGARPEATFQGKRVPLHFVQGESDEENRVFRLQLDPRSAPGLLEIEYQVTSRSPAWNPITVTRLVCPSLRGQAGRVPVRWLVAMPSSSMLVYHQGGFMTPRRLGLRGWLLAAQSAVTAGELKDWLFAFGAGPRSGEEGTSAKLFPATVAVLGTNDLGSLKLVHVSQQIWLLFCSAIVLGPGLLVYLFRPTWRLFWPVSSGLGLVAAITSLLWPGMVSAFLEGCQPGILVLLVLVGVQWLLQQRYRRQVVFMPSFKRLRAGSSLLQKDGTRPRREPSTVDAPPEVFSGS